MGKTNSLNDEDLREFVELQARLAETEHFDSAQCKNAWLVDIADTDAYTALKSFKK